MSNVNRPRTGLKACTFDGATDRDSNGQCHCRNVGYRLVRKAPQKKTAILKAFDGALKDGKSIEDAVAAAQGAVPALAPKPRKAPAKKTPAKGKKTSSTKPPKGQKAKDKAAEIVKEAVEKVTGTEAVAPAEKADPARYVLNILDDFTDPKPYARKDAAIKNGVRSGEVWNVTYKGKVVAQSDDVL
jgi:hypothetical protein